MDTETCSRRRAVAACCGVSVLPLLGGCFVDGPVSHPIISYEGDFDTTSQEFVLDGRVVNEGDAPESGPFDSVGVYLYDGEKRLLDSQSVGRLEGSASVSLSSSELPKYVVIYSPGFWDSDSLLDWNSEKVVVDYLVRADGYFSTDSATSEEELPVAPEPSEVRES